MNFNESLTIKVENIEKIIKKYLPKEEGYQRTVLEAMNYSMLAGGKRLRPMLVQEVFDAFGGTGGLAEPFMAAIEMIHTYSLVHDDLPAMDDDEYRRGRKTTHVVYGEAMGILAGDALLNYAFETALSAFDTATSEEYPRVAKALQVLARKAGIYGMIGGQVCDVESEESREPISGEQLLFIHEHKTAALIQAAMMMGGILAGVSEEQAARLEQSAYDLGIAFQIQDDILDVTSTFEELGKPIGSDEKNNKQTYVSIYGLARAKEEVKRLSEEAIALLDLEADSFLAKLFESLIYRSK
ncbi:MAG: polyprenyl synthetase family protein [Lachnospiraceae bacterium]|nr:polyprenyl synthetase family protein [Lachnospiraceae bacterium]